MTRFAHHAIACHEALRPGLTLYAASEVDSVEGLRSTGIDSGVRLPLVLQGCARVRFGERKMQLGAGESGIRSALVSIARPEQFSRELEVGHQQTVVNLTLSDAWLDQGAAGDDALDRSLEQFRREHLAIRLWQPSRMACARARELMAPPPMPVRLRRLFLESRCLDIVQEALTVLTPSTAPQQRPARLARQMAAVCEWMASSWETDWQLADLAREAGMSISTLQRHFRDYTGQTVYDYLRSCRLKEARRLLEEEGVSVTEAALMTGYANPANFATAFRREFGIAPSRCLR